MDRDSLYKKIMGISDETTEGAGSEDRHYELLHRVENMRPELFEAFSHEANSVDPNTHNALTRMEALEQKYSAISIIPGSTPEMTKQHNAIRFVDPRHQRVETVGKEGERSLHSVQDIVRKAIEKKEGVTADFGSKDGPVLDANGDPVIRLRYNKEGEPPVFRDIKATDTNVLMMGDANALDSYSIIPSSASFGYDRDEKRAVPGNYRGVGNNLGKLASDFRTSTIKDFENRPDRSGGGVIDWNMFQSNPAHLAKRGQGAVSIPSSVPMGKGGSEKRNITGQEILDYVGYMENYRSSHPLEGEPESFRTLGLRKSDDGSAAATEEVMKASFPSSYNSAGDLVMYAAKSNKHIMGTFGARGKSGTIAYGQQDAEQIQSLIGHQGYGGLAEGSLAHAGMFQDRLGFIEGQGLVPYEDISIRQSRRTFIPGLRPEELPDKVGDVFSGSGKTPRSLPEGSRYRGESDVMGLSGLPLNNHDWGSITGLDWDEQQQGTWQTSMYSDPAYNGEYKEDSGKSQATPTLREHNPYFQALSETFGHQESILAEVMPENGPRWAAKAFKVWQYQGAEDPRESESSERRANMLNQFFDEATEMGVEDTKNMVRLMRGRDDMGYVQRGEGGFAVHRKDGTLSDKNLDEVLSIPGLYMDISHEGTDVAVQAALKYANENMKDVQLNDVTVPHWQMQQVVIEKGMETLKSQADISTMSEDDIRSRSIELGSAWFDEYFDKSTFVPYEDKEKQSRLMSSKERGKEAFSGYDEDAGYWLVDYKTKVLGAWTGMNPIANFGSGKTTLKGEQMSVMQQRQPEMYNEIMHLNDNMKATSRYKILSNPLNPTGTVVGKNDPVDIKDVNFREIETEVRSRLDPTGVTAFGPKLPGGEKGRAFMESRIQEEVLRKIEASVNGAPITTEVKDGTSIYLSTGAALSNMEDKGAGYGENVYKMFEMAHGINTDGKADQDGLLDAARKVYTAGEGLAADPGTFLATQSIKMPAFTGPVGGVQGIPSNMMIVQQQDYVDNLKKSGYGHDDVKQMANLLKSGDAYGIATMQPQANRRFAFQALNIVTDEWVRDTLPGMQHVVSPEGGPLVSPEFIASQAKDSDGDRIVGMVLKMMKDQYVDHGSIIENGWNSRGQEMQSVIEKSVKATNPYSVSNATELREKKGISGEDMASQGEESALSQIRMGADYNSAIRVLGDVSAHLSNQTDTDTSRSASLFSSDIYQLSLDMKQSQDPATERLENVMHDGVISYGPSGSPVYNKNQQHLSEFRAEDGNLLFANPQAGYYEKGLKMGRTTAQIAAEHDSKYKENRDLVNRQYATNVLGAMLSSNMNHRVADGQKAGESAEKYASRVQSSRDQSRTLYMGEGMTSKEGRQFSPGVIDDHVNMLLPLNKLDDEDMRGNVRGVLSDLFEAHQAGTVDEKFNAAINERFLSAVGSKSVEDYVFGQKDGSINDRATMPVAVNSLVGANTLFNEKKNLAAMAEKGMAPISISGRMPGNMEKEANDIGVPMLARKLLTRMSKGQSFSDKFSPEAQFREQVDAMAGTDSVFAGFKDMMDKFDGNVDAMVNEVVPRKKGGKRKPDETTLVGEEGPEILTDGDGMVIPFAVYSDLHHSTKGWVDAQESISVGDENQDTPIPEELAGLGNDGKYKKADFEAAMQKRQSQPKPARNDSAGPPPLSDDDLSFMEFNGSFSSSNSEPEFPPLDYERLEQLDRAASFEAWDYENFPPDYDDSISPSEEKAMRIEASRQLKEWESLTPEEQDARYDNLGPVDPATYNNSRMSGPVNYDAQDVHGPKTLEESIPDAKRDFKRAAKARSSAEKRLHHLDGVPGAARDDAYYREIANLHNTIANSESTSTELRDVYGEQNFNVQARELANSPAMQVKEGGNLPGMVVYSENGNNITRNEIKADWVSDADVTTLDENIRVLQAKAVQAEGNPEMIQDANWQKGLVESLGKVSYLKSKAFRQRQAGVPDNLIGGEDTLQALDALVGSPAGSEEEKERFGKVQSVVDQAKQFAREGTQARADSQVEKRTPDIERSELNTVIGATKNIGELTESLKGLSDITEMSVDGQRKYHKQLKATLDLYDTIAETTGTLETLSKTRGLDSKEQATLDRLGGSDVKQFMQEVSSQRDSREQQLAFVEAQAKARDPMNDQEKQSRLTQLLARRGPGGRAAREDGANADLYENGLELFGQRITNKGALDALGGGMRTVESAKNAMFSMAMIKHNIGGPMGDAVGAFQKSEMARDQMMLQTGMASYDDVMSGSSGAMLRRQAKSGLAQRNIGEQIYNTYAPVIDFALTDTGSKNLGGLASIIAPSLGAGMMASSMTANPIAGLVAGLGTAAVTTGMYLNSASNDAGGMANFLDRKDRNMSKYGSFNGSLTSLIQDPLGSATYTFDEMFRGGKGNDEGERYQVLASEIRGSMSSTGYDPNLDEFTMPEAPGPEVPLSPLALLFGGGALAAGAIAAGADAEGSYENQLDLYTNAQMRKQAQQSRKSENLSSEQFFESVAQSANMANVGDGDLVTSTDARREFVNQTVAANAENGVGESETLGIMAFTQKYMNDNVGREMATNKDLFELSKQGVFELPTSVLNAVTSTGDMGADPDLVSQTTQRMTSYLMSQDIADRPFTAQRINDSVSRTGQLNTVRNRYGLESYNEMYFEDKGGVYDNNYNSRQQLIESEAMAASTLSSQYMNESTGSLFVQRQDQLIQDGQNRQASIEAGRFSEVSGLVARRGTYGGETDMFQAQLASMSQNEDADMLFAGFGSGDTRAATIASQRYGLGEQFQFIDTNTGLGKFETDISESEAAQLTGSNFATQYGYINPEGLTGSTYGTSVRGYQAEIRDTQRQMGIDQYQFGQQMTAAQYSAQVGSASSLQRNDSDANTVFDDLVKAAEKAGGSLSTLSDIFEESGFVLNKGDGRSLREVENDSIALNREKQTYGLDQTDASMAIKEEEFALSAKHFYEKVGFQQEQNVYGFGHQMQEFQIGRQQQVKQQQWQAEDWSFNRNQQDIGFAWQMEDYDRNIRYARGRDRRDLMRNQERSVIQYSMSAGKSDVDKGRMEESNQWSADKFDRDKEYYEQMYQFQQRGMEMQIRHFEEGRRLDEAKMELERDRVAQERVWTEAQWANEDQQRAIALQLQDFQMEKQVEFGAQVFETQQHLTNLNIELQGIGMFAQDAATSFQNLVASGDSFLGLFGATGTTPVDGISQSVSGSADALSSGLSGLVSGGSGFSSSGRSESQLDRVISLLSSILGMGPGRVNATIYTDQRSVSTDDIYDGAFVR